MGQFGIYLSQVLNEYRSSGMGSDGGYFSLTYRKADGTFGEKKRVRRRAAETENSGKRDLASIRHETRRAGKLHLTDDNNHAFELHVPLLVSFNGRLIDHRF